MSKKLLAVIMAILSVLLLLAGCFDLLPNKAETTQPPSVAPSPSDVPSPSKASPEPPVEFENPLDRWVAYYSFYEFSPPDVNMSYEFSIGMYDGVYYAHFFINGFQTMSEFIALVTGDAESIKLTFKEYTGENLFKPYEEGDWLLSLRIVKGELVTYWGGMTPMLEENAESGKAYFQIGEEPEDIYYGVTIGDGGTFYIGQPYNDVIAKLEGFGIRDVYEFEITNDPDEWDWGDVVIFTDGLTFAISETVYAITVDDDSGIPTAEGLKAGNTVDKMKELYGSDYLVYQQADSITVYEYDKGDYYFRVTAYNGDHLVDDWMISLYKFDK